MREYPRVNMVGINLLVLLFITSIHFVFAGDPDLLKALRKKIFANYSTNVRPVIDKTKTTEIHAKMHIFHIDKLNELEQSVRVHGIFQMSWTDGLLRWNNNDYNDTKILIAKNYEIWTPNIVLANSAKQSSLRYTWNLPIKVWYSGTVFASPEFSLDVSCMFDFADYPYDVQTCIMAFFASGSSLVDVKWLPLMDPELQLYWAAKENKTQISKWKIEKPTTKLKYWVKGNLTSLMPNATTARTTLPIVEIILTFTRNDIYFSMTIVVPVVLTSIVTVLALCPFVNVKLALYILLMNFIIQCFYMDNLLDTMPPTLNTIPNIAFFYAFNLAATTFAIVLRVIFLYLSAEDAKKRKATRKAVEERTNEERLPQVSEQPNISTFHKIYNVKFLNYAFLAIYSFAYFIFAVLYL